LKMSNTVKKLTIAAVLLLSFQLVILLAFAPAGYATTPNCTATATDSGTGDTYTLTVSPCTASGVSSGTGVTATASTTDSSITYVWFNFYSPTSPSTPTFQSGALSTFSYGPKTLAIPGTWVVTAYFEQGSGLPASLVYVVSVNISVQILVLNDLPLGTIAAAGVALLGLVAVRRLSKTFSIAAPTR